MSLSDLSALFLASTPLVPAPTVVPPPPRWGSQFRDFLPILGAVAVLTLILVTWLAIVRGRRRRRRHGSQGGETLVRYRSPKLDDTGLLSLLKPRRRKKRRKHRYHHRNPTLAETGGLPPIRQPAGGGAAPPVSGTGASAMPHGISPAASPPPQGPSAGSAGPGTPAAS